MRELEKINLDLNHIREQKAEAQKQLRATNYQITAVECFIAHYQQELRKLESQEFNRIKDKGLPRYSKRYNHHSPIRN